MAHVQKFSSGSAARILGHCDRELSENGQYLKYRTGSEIDMSRTGKNFSLLAGDGLTSAERLSKRLSEVYVHKRKDVNVMCDWVVTLPKELSVADERTVHIFFAETVSFLLQRYGEENAVSINVHMDESQPHLHFCFVPVVYDSRKERYKVSAKELLTRKELKAFHDDLAAHLEKTLNIEPELIHSGKTKAQGGNLSVEELRSRKSALEWECDNLQKKLYELQNAILREKKVLDGLLADINQKIAQIEKYDLIKPREELDIYAQKRLQWRNDVKQDCEEEEEWEL